MKNYSRKSKRVWGAIKAIYWEVEEFVMGFIGLSIMFAVVYGVYMFLYMMGWR